MGDKKTSKRKLLGLKIRKYIFIGCIVNIDHKNREVFALLEEISNYVKPFRKLKNNKDVIIKLKKENQNY